MIEDPRIGDLVRHKETGELLGLVTDCRVRHYKKHYDVLCAAGTREYRDYLLRTVK